MLTAHEPEAAVEEEEDYLADYEPLTAPMQFRVGRSAGAGRGIFAEVTPMRETPEVTQGRMFMLRNLMTYVEPDVAATDQIKEWTIKTFSRNQRLKSALGDAWGGLRGRTSCITVILTCDATLNLALPPSAPAAPRQHPVPVLDAQVGADHRQ